ncbi:hypothetical protein [Streptomyces sp. NPDC054834]
MTSKLGADHGYGVYAAAEVIVERICTRGTTVRRSAVWSASCLVVMNSVSASALSKPSSRADSHGRMSALRLLPNQQP